MIRRTTKHLLLPLLALSMTLALAATAQAQGSSGVSASLQVNFGSTPHWTSVRGTRVQVIRQGEQRPDYDMFRYGGSYYAYNNNHWYKSRRARGQYTMIDDRFVPREFSRVPRNHWHNYPSGWGDANGNQRSDDHGQRHDGDRGAQSSDNHDRH